LHVRARILSLIIVILAMASAAIPNRADAQGLHLVRDAEVENIIRAYAEPVFNAAGYSADDITVYLVADMGLNAFVAGGLNLFINTGLLIRSDTAAQVIGVIAHETGHISGGHLARIQGAAEGIAAETIVSYILGAAAAVVTGRGDLATAIVSGGAQFSQSGFLQYSRTQESAADHAALRFLDKSNISAQGLYEFMEILEGQELLVVGRRDPYLSTHPLTQDRLAAVGSHLATSPIAGNRLPPRFEVMHERMRAKLRAFLEPAGQVLRRYPTDDDSLPARYAQSIVYFQLPDLSRALTLIENLIVEHPDDPYFREIMGQMLFENGYIADAIPPYMEAVRMLPNSGLLRTSLAQAQIETNDPSLIPTAISSLEASWRLDQRNLLTLRLLAVAYGRNGQIGMAAVNLAELALASGRPKEALQQAERALRQLPPGAIARQRAHDIKREITGE
jgi:predicted Zn-dependent protease